MGTNFSKTSDIYCQMAFCCTILTSYRYLSISVKMISLEDLLNEFQASLLANICSDVSFASSLPWYIFLTVIQTVLLLIYILWAVGKPRKTSFSELTLCTCKNTCRQIVCTWDSFYAIKSWQPWETRRPWDTRTVCAHEAWLPCNESVLGYSYTPTTSPERTGCCQLHNSFLHWTFFHVVQIMYNISHINKKLFLYYICLLYPSELLGALR